MSYLSYTVENQNGGNIVKILFGNLVAKKDGHQKILV